MKDYKKSRFKKIIRISNKNHEWLKNNKGRYKTLAGTLDAIINKAKRGNRQSASSDLLCKE